MLLLLHTRKIFEGAFSHFTIRFVNIVEENGSVIVFPNVSAHKLLDLMFNWWD